MHSYLRIQQFHEPTLPEYSRYALKHSSARPNRVKICKDELIAKSAHPSEHDDFFH